MEASLIFTALIVLWGNYYVISWKKTNEFYSYIWGINDFKMKKDIKRDNTVTLNKMVFMGIQLPISTSYKTEFTNVIVLILSGLLKIFVMASNIIILAVKNHTFELKRMFYNNLLNKYWKYINPLIIYILREFFSFIIVKANKWLYGYQKYISESEKQKFLVKKKLIFEFFNYYFNLYYIAFIKNTVEKCLYDDCYKELEQQLIMLVKIVQKSGVDVEKLIDEWNNDVEMENNNENEELNNYNDEDELLTDSINESNSKIDPSSFIPINIDEPNINEKVMKGIPKLNFDVIKYGVENNKKGKFRNHSK